MVYDVSQLDDDFPYKNGLKLGAHPPLWGNATRVLVEFLSKQSSSSSTPWMHSAVAASGPAFAKRRPAGWVMRHCEHPGGGHPTWGPEVRDESLAWKHNDAEDADAAEFSAGVPGGGLSPAKLLVNLGGGGYNYEVWSEIPAPPNTLPKQEGLQLEEASFRDHHPVEYAEIHNPSALGYDHPFNMDAYWSPISTHIPWKIHSFVQDYLTNLNSLGGPWGSLGVPGGPWACHFSTPGQGWGNGVWAGWHVIASWGWIILWSQHATPNQQKHTTSQLPWDFPRPSTPGWNCWPHLWGNLKLLHELPGHNSMQTTVTGRNSTECWFNCSTQQGI